MRVWSVSVENIWDVSLVMRSHHAVAGYLARNMAPAGVFRHYSAVYYQKLSILMGLSLSEVVVCFSHALSPGKRLACRACGRALVCACIASYLWRSEIFSSTSSFCYFLSHSEVGILGVDCDRPPWLWWRRGTVRCCCVFLLPCWRVFVLTGGPFVRVLNNCSALGNDDDSSLGVVMAKNVLCLCIVAARCWCLPSLKASSMVLVLAGAAVNRLEEEAFWVSPSLISHLFLSPSASRNDGGSARPVQGRERERRHLLVHHNIYISSSSMLVINLCHTYLHDISFLFLQWWWPSLYP